MYFIGRKHHDPEDILAGIGLIILIFCEIFYLKDNMGDIYFRMNTVFKCYLPAWIILGSAVCLMAGNYLSGVKGIPVISTRNTRIVTVIVVGTLFVLSVCYPLHHELWDRDTRRACVS